MNTINPYTKILINSGRGENSCSGQGCCMGIFTILITDRRGIFRPDD
jgi:hypothetical protein